MITVSDFTRVEGGWRVTVSVPDPRGSAHPTRAKLGEVIGHGATVMSYAYQVFLPDQILDRALEAIEAHRRGA